MNGKAATTSRAARRTVEEDGPKYGQARGSRHPQSYQESVTALNSSPAPEVVEGAHGRLIGGLDAALRENNVGPCWTRN